MTNPPDTQVSSQVQSTRARQPGSIWAALLPPLAAALICTALIAEAVSTAFGAKANGDVMVIVCPLLGAVFLAIPAAQAWAASLRVIRRR